MTDMQVFPSKRNTVVLRHVHDCDYVAKTFSDMHNFQVECSVSMQIASLLPTPKLVHIDNDTLFYQYLPAPTLLDLLEQQRLTEAILSELLTWIAQFYEVTGLILGDAHLRNFLYADKLYGIDFESARAGHPLEDIATILVFTLSYYPICNDYALSVVDILLQQVKLQFFDANALLPNFVLSQAKAIAYRRNKQLFSCEQWDYIVDIFLKNGYYMQKRL